MMEILSVRRKERKWYEVILWWEVRRILYNVIMYFVGLASFYIAYVSIPLVYLVIGLGLNFFYTFCWIMELAIRNRLNENLRVEFPKRAFWGYLILSTILVFGVALLVMLR